MNPVPEVEIEESNSQPANTSVISDSMMPLFLELPGLNRSGDKKNTSEVRETPSTKPSCVKLDETPQMIRHTLPNPQSDESDFNTSSKRSSLTYRDTSVRAVQPSVCVQNVSSGALNTSRITVHIANTEPLDSLNLQYEMACIVSEDSPGDT